MKNNDSDDEEEQSQAREGGSSRRGGGGCRGNGGSCFCIALFGPFYCLYASLSRESVVEAKRWAAQPWEVMDCTVKDKGLAYTGNCLIHSSTRDCSSTCSGLSGMDAYLDVTSKPVPGDDVVGARRLTRCSDTYMPWISVSFPGSSESTCAYLYGIGGLEDGGWYWDEANGQIAGAAVGGTIRCLRPKLAGDCVAALQNVTQLVDDRRSWAKYSFVAMWILLPLTILAWLVVCACCFCCICNCLQAPEVRKSAYLGGEAAERLHFRDAKEQGLELPPGHWSQWDDQDIELASERLFDFYDRDRSGFLDTGEMVNIMGDLGIQDRHLVLRTMAQLDHDDSGLIEREEFGDLCRQIFWNGHQKLVVKEFQRQQKIIGTQAISATGLAENRPLLILEVIVLVALLAIVLWAEHRYGHRTCDTRFDRYLVGVAILIGFQLAILLLIGFWPLLKRCMKCNFGGMYAQGAMSVLMVFVLAYAVAGTVMEISSEVCDQKLRAWSLLAVMMLWAASLYVLVATISGFVAAYVAVRRGTSLSTLTMDDNEDSDSEYEEVEVEFPR